MLQWMYIFHLSTRSLYLSLCLGWLWISFFLCYFSVRICFLFYPFECAGGVGRWFFFLPDDRKFSFLLQLMRFPHQLKRYLKHLLSYSKLLFETKKEKTRKIHFVSYETAEAAIKSKHYSLFFILWFIRKQINISICCFLPNTRIEIKIMQPS